MVLKIIISCCSVISLFIYSFIYFKLSANHNVSSLQGTSEKKSCLLDVPEYLSLGINAHCTYINFSHLNESDITLSCVLLSKVPRTVCTNNMVPSLSNER